MTRENNSEKRGQMEGTESEDGEYEVENRKTDGGRRSIDLTVSALVHKGARTNAGN